MNIYWLTATHKALFQGLKISQWTKYTMSQSSCNIPAKKGDRQMREWQVCVTFIICAHSYRKTFHWQRQYHEKYSWWKYIFYQSTSILFWWYSQNSRKNIFQNDFIPRENRLLNLHVAPGLHFKNTFICKLIAFISLVSTFFFFSDISTGYFIVHISSKSKLFSCCKERHL